MAADVAVLGAGLAGLACARDLARGGADVVVLEARHRVGGRVEQVRVDDGRPVQLGGEVVGPFHRAYLELVDELGLTIGPSYVAEPGTTTFDLLEGVERSDDSFCFQTPEEAADFRRVEGLYGALVSGVDPDDPWGHPDAGRLDGVSVGDWLRSVGALPATVRALETGALAGAHGSIERTSLLADLRKSAAASERGFYGYDRWESLQVVEGSAEVAERMAAELVGRLRLGAVAARVTVSASGCRVRLEGGEELRADAVVSALPVGVLHGIPIAGVSEERLDSLTAQRNAQAAKAVAVFDRSFWLELGASGLAEGEHVLGSTWPQRPGTLSALVPPDRIAYLEATAPRLRAPLVLTELERMYGPAAATAQHVFLRMWGTDPFTRGYVTSWWPGDVMRVGPLHGTHEPPFYVCGSDQWVAGYMEGAVRTGRAAAAAALGLS